MPRRLSYSAPAGGGEGGTGMGPVDVTVDLRFLPDLDDLSCHQDIRLPSVAHNRPPAAARAHAAHTAPEGTTDAGATERPVMSGHDRTQPRSKAVYRQAAWSRYSRRGTMTQPDAELPHLGNRIADLVRLILVRPALRPTREMASSARMTVSEPTRRRAREDTLASALTTALAGPDPQGSGPMSGVSWTPGRPSQSQTPARE